MSNRLRSVIIVLVAAVWAVNFTAPIFLDDFKPTPEVNVVFMAIIGILTASYKRDSDDDKDEPEHHEEEPVDDEEGSEEEVV